MNRFGLRAFAVAGLTLMGFACSGGGSNLTSGVSGVGSNFTLLSISYGRLVEVRDSNNVVISKMVIDPAIDSDGQNYLMTTNPITEVTELRILPATGTPEYEAALKALDTNPDGTTKLVTPKVKGPNDTYGFEMIPDNAVVKLKFSLPVDFATVGQNTIKVLAGSPPAIPFNGVFYAQASDLSVVIFKPTVTGFENATFGISVNSTGFPPAPNASANNLDFVFPVKTESLIGQNVALRSQDGNYLVALNNPVMVPSPLTPTQATVGDIVRKLRTGGSFDTNGGYLLDSVKPAILGVQNVTISSVSAVGDDFDVDFTFNETFCGDLPAQVGDVVLQGDNFGVVISIDDYPTVVRVSMSQGTLSTGSATYKTVFNEVTHANLIPCFVAFSPAATITTGPTLVTIDPAATLTVEFSKPLKSETVLPFRTFALTNRINVDTATSLPGAIITDLSLAPDPNNPNAARMNNFVAANIQVSSDKKRYTFIPLQSINNDPVSGGGSTAADRYDLHLVLGSSGPVVKQGLQDLAGNRLDLTSDFVMNAIKIGGSAFASTSAVFRFKTQGMDEDAVPGAEVTVNGLSGQGTYVAGFGGVVGRSPVPYRRNIDDTQTFVALMPVTSVGLQTPLVALGARMMTMYRYHDVFGGVVPAGEGGAKGPSVIDKDGWNVDIIGLNWSPFGANLIPDNFGRFAIRAGHSLYGAVANVDSFNTTCPWWFSGFNDSTSTLASNTGARNTFDNQVFELAGFTAYSHNEGMNNPAQYKTVFDFPYKIISSNTFIMGAHTFTPFESINNNGSKQGFMTSFRWRDTTLVEPTGTDIGLPFMAGSSVYLNTSGGPGTPLWCPANPAPASAAPYTGNVDGADSSEFLKAQASANLTYRYVPTTVSTGGTVPTHSLPSVALPLLFEFRCYNNSQQAIQAQGSNGLATSFMYATNQLGQFNPPPAPSVHIMPASRVFSQGFINTSNGTQNPVDPDNEPIPQGGWCPAPCPTNGGAGATTTSGWDPTMYWSVIDMQNTISIFHSRWINTGLTTPTYSGAVIEPAAADLPSGTSIIVEFRGASNAVAGAANTNAYSLDPYGNCHGVNPTVNTLSQYATCGSQTLTSLTDWTTDITTLNGKKFIQARFKLVANATAQTVPTITGFGITYH